MYCNTTGLKFHFGECRLISKSKRDYKNYLFNRNVANSVSLLNRFSCLMSLCSSFSQVFWNKRWVFLFLFFTERDSPHSFCNASKNPQNQVSVCACSATVNHAFCLWLVVFYRVRWFLKSNYRNGMELDKADFFLTDHFADKCPKMMVKVVLKTANSSFDKLIFSHEFCQHFWQAAQQQTSSATAIFFIWVRVLSRS